jgi:hypothetical protein
MDQATVDAAFQEPIKNMQRHALLQMRPEGGNFYSPQRDVAWIGPQLCRRGFVALDPRFYEPWFAAFCAQAEVGPEDFEKAALPFAKALNEIIGVADPNDAFRKHGFFELPPAVQLAVFAKIGQVFIGCLYSGVKDVSRPQDKPPTDIAAMVEEAAAVAERMGREAQRRWSPSTLLSKLRRLFGRPSSTTRPNS